MKQKLLLFAFTIVSTMLFSQATPMAFEDWKSNNGTQNFFYKNIIKTDASGNIYTLGATTTSNSTTDILLSKKNSSGVTLWTKQINGTANYHDFGSGLVITTSGDVYITGAITNNTTTLAPALIVVKYNSSGTQQFSSTYSGAGYGALGKDITVDASNGNSYVAGSEYNSSQVADILTVCFNGSGTLAWSDTYDYYSFNDGGVKIGFKSNKVTVTGAVTESANNYKICTLTYTATTGVRSETTTLGSTMTSSVEIVTDMVTDASGNIYICGATEVNGQGYNYYLAKLTSSLTLAWQQTYNGTSNMNDQAKGVQVDGSGNVYVTGYSTSSTQAKNFTTIKYNSSGTQQWVQSYNSNTNGNDEAYDMEIDNSSNIYITGSTSSDINSMDYYTIKYNSSGTKIWEIQNDGSHLNDYATNITLDSLNNVIITGQSETSPNNYVYTTRKIIQRDVITPADFDNESPSPSYWFYSNQGQITDVNNSKAENVMFYTDKTSPNMYINSNSSMSFVFSKIDTISTTSDTIQRVDLTFESSRTAKAYPVDGQKFYISYFKGANDDYTSIRANSKLVMQNIYSNIDLMYSSNENGIKYYFIIKPGGNPSDILPVFTGAQSYSLNGTTNQLTLNTVAGSLTLDRPIAYQLSSTNTVIAITSWTPSWQTNGASNKFKFSTGAYTSSLTLIIEIDKGNSVYSPTANGNLLWNTFQGGNGDDHNKDLKLDKYGNIYTLAETWSSNYYVPNTTTFGNPVLNNQGTLIMKYDKFGRRYNQVYFGSNSNTSGEAITIVGDSSVVIVGSTSGSSISSPIGGNPVGTYTSSTGAGFIVKFKKTLSAIEWSTHYPGTITDVDSKNNGDIYLCAFSPSTTVFIKNKTNATNISTSSANISQVVTKFDKNGIPLWSSFIGVRPTTVSWYASHIKVDSTSNQFYVFGRPNGLSDWVGYNNYGTFFHNSFTSVNYADDFIKKFNSNDSMIVSTLVGGNKEETLYDAAIAPNGDVTFVGETYSTDSINTVVNPGKGAYISTKCDGIRSKGWILKFTPTFDLKWATLYGDSAHTTSFRGVATDNKLSSVLIGGYTEGMPYINYSGGYGKTTKDVQGDGAFVSFDPSNKVTWSTPMGSQGIAEYGIYAVQYNPVYNNLVFAGGSSAIYHSDYPWENYYSDSYYQPGNFSVGQSDCNVGIFNAILLVGIEELKNDLVNSQIVLYPNPTNASTNLYFKEGLSKQTKIIVSNVIGQIIETRNYASIENETVLKFNTSQFSEGIYFITITTENTLKTLKLIVTK